MGKIIFAVFAFALANFTVIQSANILFYFGVSTLSHRLIVWPLVEQLASRGHNVTFFSPYEPVPNSNVTQYTSKELADLTDSYVATGSDLIRDRFDGKEQAVWSFLPVLSLVSCEMLMNLPDFKNWVNSSRFDLVILDGTYCECGFGLAYKWGARVAYFKTTTMFPWESDMLGIPVEASWIPNVSKDYPQDMGFWTRVKNTVNPIYNYLWHTWVYHPKLEGILRTALDIPNMPRISEMFGNMSLVLMNADYSTDYARSLPPLIVQVNGMVTQGSTVEPMSPEMLKFANSATQGFLYVSFGGAVQVSKMKPELRSVFFETFRNSAFNFILKYEVDEVPEGMPENVYIAKWMPQQAILRHTNCRGFITHSGLGGIHEAIKYSVPLILLPIFAEQNYNAERVARLGHGIRLELTTLTQNQLQNAIRNLTEYPSFKAVTEQLSVSLADRQQNPLDTGVWWVEKVLRSSEFDLSLRRPLGRHQSWFVRRSLDVYLFLFLMSLSPFVLLYVVLNRRGNIKLEGRKIKKN